jgi:septum formation protein
MRKAPTAVVLMGSIAKNGSGRTPHHHISARRFQIGTGLYHPRVSIVLASASPRRRELLRQAGIDVEVVPVDIDERRQAGEAAESYVDRLAREKASAGLDRRPHATVIGADTVVVVDGEVLGKPADAADARRMLEQLSGRTHAVLTGVAVARQGHLASHVERTDVLMREIDEAELAWYLASGEPMDKAGAYAIQGLASRFVTRIEGSYPNVVGLPVATVVALLGLRGAPGN